MSSIDTEQWAIIIIIYFNLEQLGMKLEIPDAQHQILIILFLCSLNFLFINDNDNDYNYLYNAHKPNLRCVVTWPVKMCAENNEF